MDVNISDKIPREILVQIFSTLPANDLKSCLEVNETWKAAGLEENERRWKQSCERYYPTIYKEAFRKSRLNWQSLYHSLSLWSQIKTATRNIYKSSRIELGYTELALDRDEVRSFQVLKDGIVSYPCTVEKIDDEYHYCDKYDNNYRDGLSNAIMYYDTATLRPVRQKVFDFHFSIYAETDEIIVLHRGELQLFIQTKANNKLHHIGEMLQYDYGDYSKFYVAKNKVFHLDPKHNLYMTELVTENGEVTVKSGRLTTFDTEKNSNYWNCQICAVSYIDENQVNILTARGHVYSIIDHTVQHLDRVEKQMTNRNEVVNKLKQYGFDWSHPEVYRWISSFDIIDGDWVAITHIKKATVYSYGQVVIIGTSRRTLHVYYNPYKNGQLKLYNRKPTLKIDLNEWVPISNMSEMPSSDRTVRQIEVIEIPHGHRVLLIYCQRLVSIEFINEPLKRNIQPSTCAVKVMRTE